MIGIPLDPTQYNRTFRSGFVHRASPGQAMAMQGCCYTGEIHANCQRRYVAEKRSVQEITAGISVLIMVSVCPIVAAASWAALCTHGKKCCVSWMIAVAVQF